MNAQTGLRRPKAVVLDLDGTLYQDEVICYRLVDHFFADTPYAVYADDLKALMTRVLRGEETVKCGHFVPKLPLRAVMCAEDFLRVPSIAGLAEPNAPDYFDRAQFSYIGDGWSLAMYWARRVDFAEDEYWRLFRPARADLLSDTYGPAVSPALKEALRALRQAGIRLYLCSNSQARDAMDFLTKHGLRDAFDARVFDAHKPRTYPDILRALDAQRSLDWRDYLFVGDQGYSDLYMGHTLGAQTLLVSPFHIEDGMNWTARVRTADELAGTLRQLAAM